MKNAVGERPHPLIGGVELVLHQRLHSGQHVAINEVEKVQCRQQAKRPCSVAVPWVLVVRHQSA